MKLARALLTPLRLVLRRPVVTARERLDGRDGLLLCLEAETGEIGYGEALPLAGFGLEPLERATEAVTAAVRALLTQPWPDLAAALDSAERHTSAAPSARAALDVALHDVFARAQGRSIAALLSAQRGAEPHADVPVNALIAATDVETAARHARQAVSRGFRALKLKVGCGDVEADVRRAAAVRAAAGPDVELRLDANGAWDEATAVAALERLAPLDIAFVEQPVPADALDALVRVREASPIPIAADESVRDEARARTILERKAADLLVVKPAALGGLRPASRIAARAAAAGVGVVVTGLLDSAVGLAAALHLAAALPDPRRAAGLATDALFETDLAALPRIAAGRRGLPEGPGLGVVPKPKHLARLTREPAQELRG
ncbi:MAG TPA: o-succinylbenzoate synthase [Myxococcota bacterium]